MIYSADSSTLAVGIFGAQYGDEGKGKLVYDTISHFATKYAKVVCVRFNGGGNAGHSIYVNGVLYDTHTIPSGIIHPQCVNIIGNGVVVNPQSFFSELHKLCSKGINPHNRLFISHAAHVTLTVHCMVDAITGAKIGTTKKGIGQTVSDKARRIGIRMQDIKNNTYKEKIAHLYNEYRYLEQHPFSFTVDHPQPQTFTSLDDMMAFDINFIEEHLQNTSYCDGFLAMIMDTARYLHQCDMQTPIVFEGANSIMLDPDFGTYPNVTSTSCAVSSALTGSGVNIAFLMKRNFEVVGVTKAYITRVGGGTLPTEDSTSWGNDVQRLGCEYGVTTGRKRRTGHLDLYQLKYATMLSGYTSLNLVKLDILSTFDEVCLCTGYVDKVTGQPLEYFPADEDELAKVSPVYHRMGGWKDFVMSNCKNYEDLHENVRAFITYIEEYVGVPVRYINTGKEAGQLIVRL